MSAALTLAGLAAFAVVLGVSAWTDATRYRIPNLLPALLALGAVIAAAPLGPPAWTSRGLSAALVGGLAVTLYLTRGMGGGDVKLLAAAALWMPLPTLPLFVLALGLAGGLQALAMLALRRRAPAPAGRARGGPRPRLPYGVSIAAAGLAWAAAQAAAVLQPPA